MNPTLNDESVIWSRVAHTIMFIAFFSLYHVLETRNTTAPQRTRRSKIFLAGIFMPPFEMALHNLWYSQVISIFFLSLFARESMRTYNIHTIVRYFIIISGLVSMLTGMIWVNLWIEVPGLFLVLVASTYDIISEIVSPTIAKINIILSVILSVISSALLLFLLLHSSIVVNLKHIWADLENIFFEIHSKALELYKTTIQLIKDYLC